MRQWLAAGLFAIGVAAGGAAAQDPPKQDAPKPASEAKELLKKGLETSTGAGGFTFKGTVDQDSPFGGVVIGGMSAGPEGKCTGTVGADGITHVRLEKGKSIYEFYRKGSKIAHRLAWRGAQVTSGSFAREAMGILDLAKLVKVAAKLKEKDIKKEEGRKVGEVECVTVKATLPSDLVEEEDEAAEGEHEMQMFELKKIEATFHFGKEDNLLKKVEFRLVKSFGAMFRMGGAGGDEDEEEGDGNPMKGSFATTFKLTVGAFAKSTSVSVPEDMAGFLKE
jgi:hypothetical protein